MACSWRVTEKTHQQQREIIKLHTYWGTTFKMNHQNDWLIHFFNVSLSKKRNKLLYFFMEKDFFFLAKNKSRYALAGRDLEGCDLRREILMLEVVFGGNDWKISLLVSEGQIFWIIKRDKCCEIFEFFLAWADFPSFLQQKTIN